MSFKSVVGRFFEVALQATECWRRDPGLRLRLPWARVKPPLRGFDAIFKRTLWNAVTRAALCAGRGTAFARRPAATLTLKKRRKAEQCFYAQDCDQPCLQKNLRALCTFV
jgi:hypothetical protein